MKNPLYLISFCILLFLSSCGASYQIETKKDPYKNMDVVTLYAWHDVTEGWVDNYAANYRTEIKNSKRSPTELTLHLKYATSEENLKEEFFIKVDGKMYNLKFNEITLNNHSLVDANTQVVVGGFKTFKATIILPEEIEQSLLSAKSMTIRMYTGKNPTSLEASDDQLTKLKEFLMMYR